MCSSKPADRHPGQTNDKYRLVLASSARYLAAVGTPFLPFLIVGLGELCKLRSDRGEFDCLAEVVGFRGQHVLLMPLGEMTGLHAGAEVMACDLPPLPTPGRPDITGHC